MRILLSVNAIGNLTLGEFPRKIPASLRSYPRSVRSKSKPQPLGAGTHVCPIWLGDDLIYDSILTRKTSCGDEALEALVPVQPEQGGFEPDTQNILLATQDGLFKQP